jgi:hypothetical protein
MIDNLDNIDKVIKILSKSISKKYPYLSNIQVVDIDEDVGIIRIEVDLNLNKFLEYNKLRLRPNLNDLLTRYSDDIEYLESLFSRKLYYLNMYIPDDDEEMNDSFGYKKNYEIESYLQEMMDMLPPQLVPNYKYHSVLTDTMLDYSINFRVMGYNVEFDPERYLDYLKKLD